jgi:hypothetical protein
MRNAHGQLNFLSIRARKTVLSVFDASSTQPNFVP